MVGAWCFRVYIHVCGGGDEETSPSDFPTPSQKYHLDKHIIAFFVFLSIIAVEEAQHLYQLRKVALEARQNKPDLNNHYTKIKVPCTIDDIDFFA